MKKIFFCGLFLIALSTSAQEINTAKLDSLLNLIEENDKGMGSLSVFKDGKEVYQKSIGFADVENGIEATGRTKYRVGSITKMFTATVIMQLIEEGKLTLDTKLSSYYPLVPNAPHIEVLDLLKHQSGIFNFGKDPAFEKWKYTALTKEELLEKFRNYPADFLPKEKSSYSNTNYILLGFILEDIERKPLSQIFEERIIDPLKLSSTYYGSSITPSKDEAFSYNRLSKWERNPETHVDISRGAGAMVSTPRDLNIFLNALFNGRLVKRETLELMKQPGDKFGLGMYPISFYKQKELTGHTGSIDGFATMLAYEGGEDISIAYSSNGYNMVMDDLMLGIFSTVFNEPYDLPGFSGVKLTREQLVPFEGLYRASTFPFKIKVFVENDVLMAQGTNQPSFPLDAFEKNKFKFDRAKLTLEFFPEERKMVLDQGGKLQELTKE